MTFARTTPLPRHGLALAALSIAAALAAAAPAQAAQAAPSACTAQSGPTVPTVVELYTSQGCSSCPPAERWLSGLKGRDGVVALAFHVDYWDYIGWKDRYAQPLFTQRQNGSQRTSGARFAYTPQVIVDSRDAPAWNTLPAAALQPHAPATVALALARDADGLALTVTPGAGAPAALSGYIAVVDDGLSTPVGAGENRGATLQQDAVVRELLPWSLAGRQPATLRFAPHAAPDGGAARHWVAVATDGPFGKPVQALTLACAH
ncbi:MAG: DUF1223 domain-containing protein [Burkholderiaceae bacterium]